MKYTLEELQKMMEDNVGSLDLRGTQITSLPDGLTVGSWLVLSGTQITNRTKFKKLQNGDYVPIKKRENQQVKKQYLTYELKDIIRE